jgi:hypothetical protein
MSSCSCACVPLCRRPFCILSDICGSCYCPPKGTFFSGYHSVSLQTGHSTSPLSCLPFSTEPLERSFKYLNQSMSLSSQRHLMASVTFAKVQTCLKPYVSLQSGSCLPPGPCFLNFPYIPEATGRLAFPSQAFGKVAIV